MYQGKTLDELLEHMGYKRATIGQLVGRAFAFTASDGQRSVWLHGCILRADIVEESLKLLVDKDTLFGERLESICWNPKYKWRAYIKATSLAVFGVFELR